MKSLVTHTTTQYATTYYVRDPQGNVLAVYERKRGETGQGTLTLTEQHLYGAGRIGMRKRNLALGGGAEEPVAPSTHYALTNHLGNVLAVISDAPGGGTQPTVESLTDYYPFGMAMPGRSYNASAYRFGYTGHKKEGDLAEGVYTTQYRLLDTRLGRWMSVDPLFGKYADMSSYNYCTGNPVRLVDPTGESTHVSEDGTVISVNEDNDLGVYINQREPKDKPKFSFKEYKPMSSDKKQYLMSYIGGEKIGETEYWDEFINPGTKKIFEDIKIHIGESFDQIVEDYHSKANSENLMTVALKSGGGGEYDVKAHLGMYGAKLEGKYVTTRSVGNYLAAYNAATCTLLKVHINWETFQKLAGALHIEESHGKRLSRSQKAEIVLTGQYSGCSDEKAFKTAPTYGEVNYQYRMSKKGWDHAKK